MLDRPPNKNSLIWMLWRNPDSRANRWEVSLFTPTEIHDGPAPADRKLDANTEKSVIRYINNIMTAKKLNEQKAGPMSLVSEETKADSIGLTNLKGTAKATLETLRRIQRQTAKALSLLGTASITGMGIAGLLLAPFPVPTADVREVREALPEDVEVFGTPEVVTQDHKKKLPLPPAPIVDSVRIDVYAAQWPHPGTSERLGISVGHDDLLRSDDCYYFTGPRNPVGTDYSYCWWLEEHRDFEDWFDEFLCVGRPATACTETTTTSAKLNVLETAWQNTTTAGLPTRRCIIKRGNIMPKSIPLTELPTRWL